MRRWIVVLAVIAVAVAVVLVTDVPSSYVFAPLLGVTILWFGLGSLRSLQAGAAHIPDGDPMPVDIATERITYWCAGCGAEVLLLIRGTESAPRHCGERMRERVEIARERLGGDV